MSFQPTPNTDNDSCCSSQDTFLVPQPNTFPTEQLCRFEWNRLSLSLRSHKILKIQMHVSTVWMIFFSFYIPQSITTLGKVTIGKTPKTSTMQTMAKNSERPFVLFDSLEGFNNGILSDSCMFSVMSKLVYK